MASLGNNITPSLNNGQARGLVSAEATEILGRSPVDPTRNPWGTTPRPEPYVDAKEGAAFLRLHAKTLMRLAREGAVPAYSFSEGSRRHWRFLLSELDTWMRSKVNSNAHPVRPCPANGRRK
jgi:excisionase family DNA binding protein